MSTWYGSVTKEALLSYIILNIVSKQLTASADRTARLFDSETNECIAVMSGHEMTLKCANFHPTNKSK